METSFSFEIDHFDVLDKLNLVLRSLEDVLKSILKILLSAMPLLQKTSNVKNNTQSANASNAAGNSTELPTVSGLHEIAGLNSIKSILYTLVILPRHQPQLFKNRRIGNTILLYGPPGTGKTRLVHGLAAESGAVLHGISIGSLLSAYVGETEKNIRNIFNLIRTSEQFSILFIDEIDGLCRKRTSTEHEYSRRIKTELMCQITKIDNCSNAVVVAATNCPWDLDSAILRRFQKRVYVPLPNREERVELFQLLTKDITIIQNCEQLEELINLCEGYSGSDISSLVHDALDIPLTELQSTTIWNRTPDGFYEPLTKDTLSVTDTENICIENLSNLPSCSVRARPVSVTDFLEAAKHIQCTVTSDDLDKYDKFRQKK